MRSNVLPKHPSTRDELLTIGDAARLLGVSLSTLRNWDRAKKLKARRHPINRYRLYERREVEVLSRRITGERREKESR